MDHARMRELDDQFNDCYCKNCERNRESVETCEICGEIPKSIDKDTLICSSCKEHLTIIKICETCGEKI